MKEMKLYELKELLRDALDKLENYDEEQNVKVKSNTYYVRGDFISITGVGFVELYSPVEEDEDEE